MTPHELVWWVVGVGLTLMILALTFKDKNRK